MIICKPADPKAKGLVERFHDYLERSFLPGRTFTGPADFDTQLAALLQRANARRMRVLCCSPADRIGADTQGDVAAAAGAAAGGVAGRHSASAGSLRPAGR